MSNNDKQIKDLLTKVETKRKELGTKPKPHWKTNAVVKIADESVNINTINSIERCIKLTARILMEKSHYLEACKLLGVPEKDSEQISLLNDSLDDIKLRVQMIVWDGEKKKLGALEKKLKDLRSDDAKTADALTNIANEL